MIFYKNETLCNSLFPFLFLKNLTVPLTFRSLEIFDNHPFLGFLFLSEFRKNFPVVNIKQLNIGLYLHLRLADDQEKDWVHTDSGVYTCIIYLNNTNYDSGTQIFNEVTLTIQSM